MDEGDLRIFVSLSDTENTRDTAAELLIGQSSVSRALGRLEAELGAQLFSREGRRVRINRVGASVLPDAVRALEAMQALRRRAGVHQGDGDVLRIGFLQSTAASLLPALVSTIRASRPGLRLELRQGFHREFAQLIDEDALDVALTTPPRLEDTRMQWVELESQPLCIAIPPTHRLSGRTDVEISELRGEPLVAFARGTELRATVDRMLQAAGVQTKIIFESSEIDTIRGLVAAGFGAAVLPRPPGFRTGSAEHIAITPAQVRRLGLAWPTDRRIPVDVHSVRDAWERLPEPGIASEPLPERP